MGVLLNPMADGLVSSGDLGYPPVSREGVIRL
jgi:hypothetical protein